MIESFNQIEHYTKLTKFQSNILDSILPLLLKINLSDLSDYSFINESNNCINISLVHKDDNDTNITLNVFEGHVQLNYTSCVISYEDNFDIEEFSNIYKSCLLGNYTLIEFYVGRKLILSKTSSENTHLNEFIIPHTVFYKAYFWYYKNKFVFNTVNFKSFII